VTDLAPFDLTCLPEDIHPRYICAIPLEVFNASYGGAEL
jgi:hypothetical protein